MSDYQIIAPYSYEYRHWHRTSETYTGMDSLISLLRVGWQIVGEVYREIFPLVSAQKVAIFHIYLRRAGTIQRISLIDTPHFHRLLRQQNVAIRKCAEGKPYACEMHTLELSKSKIAS